MEHTEPGVKSTRAEMSKMEEVRSRHIGIGGKFGPPVGRGEFVKKKEKGRSNVPLRQVGGWRGR